MDLFNKTDKGFPSQKDWFCSEKCAKKSNRAQDDTNVSFRPSKLASRQIKEIKSQKFTPQDDIDLDLDLGF